MKHSINAKFVFIFAGLMILTILGCLVMNNIFLQRYYISSKKTTLVQIYQKADQLWDSKIFEAESEEDRKAAEEKVRTEMERMAEEYGAAYLIVGSNWMMSLSSENNMNSLQKRMYHYIFDREQQIDDQKYPIISIDRDPFLGAEYLECFGFLSSGYPIIITIPLESVRENAEIANRFLSYVGMIAILVGTFLVFFTSSQITKPIRQLSDISEQISHLDFEAKYTGKSKDEIGVLGNNMNLLSERLEKTITDLKLANLELQKDIEHKDQVDEMRKEFISNVSHELKTPIALIQGYAEGLRDGVTDDPENMQYYCDVIVDEADKMNQMVRKLLTLNQLEFGNNQLVISRFEICEMIKNIVENTSILAISSDITIENRIKGPIYVYGDDFQIEEVITNFISNAINHCDGIKKITIDQEMHDNLVRIKVINTGKPIPEESLERVWEKFYKVDKARTREYGGSGIGLSIVKAIMESHEMKYGVYNTDDGVCFWFELEMS